MSVPQSCLSVPETYSSAAPSVQVINQVSLQLKALDAVDPFKAAQQVVLDWLNDPRIAGEPLSNEALAGRDFDLSGLASNRTCGVSLDEPHYWAVRNDKACDTVPLRTWVTEIGIAEQNDETVLLGAKLTCVSRGFSPPITPSIQRFVRQLAVKTDVYLDGYQIRDKAQIVDSEDDVDALIEHLISDNRTCDIIVVSLPEGGLSPRNALVDVNKLASSLFGVAHVYLITNAGGFHLSDKIGAEFSVYRAAIRTYHPKFNPDMDQPFAHPLATAERIKGWAKLTSPYSPVKSAFASFLIRSTISHTAQKPDIDRRIPSFAYVRQMAAQLKRDRAIAIHDLQHKDNHQDIVRLYEEELKTIRKQNDEDREINNALLLLADQDKERLQQEIAETKDQNRQLRARIDFLSSALKDRDPNSITTKTPEDLSCLGDWAQQNLIGSVFLHNKAIKGATKAPYENVPLVYKSLLLMRDFYVPMRTVASPENRKLYQEELAKLGLDDEECFTKAGWGNAGDEFTIMYKGEKRRLDRHLKGSSSKDPKFGFRLYFFWDEEDEQVIVGWLPTHLRTKDT